MLNVPQYAYLVSPTYSHISTACPLWPLRPSLNERKVDGRERQNGRASASVPPRNIGWPLFFALLVGNSNPPSLASLGHS